MTERQRDQRFIDDLRAANQRAADRAPEPIDPDWMGVKL
jgi:hypothetical protein